MCIVWFCGVCTVESHVQSMMVGIWPRGILAERQERRFMCSWESSHLLIFIRPLLPGTCVWCMCVCMSMCVCMCMCVSVHACVCVCACVWEVLTGGFFALKQAPESRALLHHTMCWNCKRLKRQSKINVSFTF